MRHQLQCILSAAALIVTAAAAAANPLPGTYRAAAAGTQTPATIGNELVLVQKSGRRIAFGLNAIRISDKNTGYISGSFVAGPNVVWIESGNGVRCRLRFVAGAPERVRVTQDTRFGDCGFGYGVVADGLYVRTRTSGKIAPWNGP